MTARALHLMEAERMESENCGDDNAGPLEVVASDDELMRWLKVSNRFALLEKRMANAETMVNRITTRFATEGRPLPESAA